MKTIRRLPTRLVIETEAGLVLQWLWYRLGRRQDTSELEHPLRSRDPKEIEWENIEESTRNMRRTNGNILDSVKGEGEYN
jgi:cell division protein FtsL